MKIGIFGTGDVGRTLANGFLATGNQVMMGSREAGNKNALAWAKEAGARSAAATGTFSDAAKFAEVVVLAVSWTGAENAEAGGGREPRRQSSHRRDACLKLRSSGSRARHRTHRFRRRTSPTLAAGSARCQGVQQCRLRAYVPAG